MDEHIPYIPSPDVQQPQPPPRPAPERAPLPSAGPDPQSWHWQRADPLGPLYASYPLKLLVRDHVGLDVGSQWLKYAISRHGAGKQRLIAAGGVPIRARGQGEMGKIRAQVGALLAIREKVERKLQRWVVGISGPGTMVRSVEVPRMPRGELREAILWQAQKKIPFPMDEAHVAIRYLKSGSNQPVRAVVAAAIKRMVEDLLFLLAEAEIQPSAITLPAFTLGTLLGHAGFRQPGEYYGMLDIGAERSLLAVYHGEVMEFFREIDLGISDVEEALAKDPAVLQRYHLEDPEQAGQILFGAGLGHDPAHVETDDETARAVSTALEKLLLEIQSTLEYYSAQAGGLRINTIMLLGGGAQIPGVERLLSNALEIPVRKVDPLDDATRAALQHENEFLQRSNWYSAYGYSLVPKQTPNLLPKQFLREQEAEFKSLMWRTTTGTAVALSLVVAGAEYYRSEFATDRLVQLQAQLHHAQTQLDELGVPHMEATLAANQRWLDAISRQDVNVASILRTLAAHTPPSIAVDRVDIRPIDSGWAHISLSGEVRTSHDQDEVVLARFVERLRATGWLQRVRLENHITNRKPNFEQLVFHVNLRVPLDAGTR